MTCAVPQIIAVIFYFYTNLTTLMLSFFSCPTIDSDSPSQPYYAFVQYPGGWVGGRGRQQRTLGGWISTGLIIFIMVQGAAVNDWEHNGWVGARVVRGSAASTLGCVS